MACRETVQQEKPALMIQTIPKDSSAGAGQTVKGAYGVSGNHAASLVREAISRELVLMEEPGKTGVATLGNVQVR